MATDSTEGWCRELLTSHRIANVVLIARCGGLLTTYILQLKLFAITCLWILLVAAYWDPPLPDHCCPGLAPHFSEASSYLKPTSWLEVPAVWAWYWCRSFGSLENTSAHLARLLRLLWHRAPESSLLFAGSLCRRFGICHFLRRDALGRNGLPFCRACCL